MWESKTFFEVAVFWPIGGKVDCKQGEYGGATRCDTEQKAIAEREQSIRLGYKPELVHIRKVVVKVLTPTPEPQ